MRLHVGNGAVLLRDYVNVDLPLPGVYLAKERPDLVEQFITTEDDYYGRHRDKTPDTLRAGPLCVETVTDAYGSFSFLPARSGTVSEILSRQVFEHLDRQEAAKAVEESYRVLRIGGLLRLDIPDAELTLERYRETGDQFFIRHLLGPDWFKKKGQWDLSHGFHVHYRRDMLRSLVEEWRFRFVKEEQHPHFYPSFCLQFEKIS